MLHWVQSQEARVRERKGGKDGSKREGMHCYICCCVTIRQEETQPVAWQVQDVSGQAVWKTILQNNPSEGGTETKSCCWLLHASSFPFIKMNHKGIHPLHIWVGPPCIFWQQTSVEEADLVMAWHFMGSEVGEELVTQGEPWGPGWSLSPQLPV